MTAPVDAATVALARLRQHGHLPASGLPVGDMEYRADQTGHRVYLVDDHEGEPLLVLGWHDWEPPASTRAPKLSRRTLSATATRTLVVVHALITDPRVDRTVTTTEQVLATIELLTGRSGQEWAVPALQHTLPDAGLTAPAAPGWCAGPRMRSWDAATRDVMAHAARRLWQHPSWPVVSDA